MDAHGSAQIGEIVRARRLELGLTQAELAAAIRVEQPYVSRIERGSRNVLQVELRRQLANALELAPEELGVSNRSDESSGHPLGAAEARRFVKVASIAREAGYPSDAAAAAKEVTQRLPTRDLTVALAAARSEALLVQAVALGDIYDVRNHHPGLALLREGYRLAQDVGDAGLVHAVTLKLGNEMRKAGDPGAASRWLTVAVDAAPTMGAAQATRIALLRVLGELGDKTEGAKHVRLLRGIEDSPELWTPTLHPLSAAEAEARYLLSFGRAVRADIQQRLTSPSSMGVAPQWHVIARLTLAEALMASGDDDRALSELITAIDMTRKLEALPRLQARGLELVDRNRAADQSIRDGIHRADR